MKARYLLCIALLMCFGIFNAAHATSYTIEAIYSNHGMPVFESDGDFTWTIPTLDTIQSKNECIKALHDKKTGFYALGKALSSGATLVTLKCVKTWQYKNCEGVLNIGCFGQADIGKPRQIPVYADGAIIPDSLRLSDDGHYQVLRTIAFTRKTDEDGNRDIVFAVQTEYKRWAFERIIGKPVSCEVAIGNSKFQSMFRRMYFTERRQGPFLLTCFSVNSEGVVSEEGSVVVRRR